MPRNSDSLPSNKDVFVKVEQLLVQIIDELLEISYHAPKIADRLEAADWVCFFIRQREVYLETLKED